MIPINGPDDIPAFGTLEDLETYLREAIEELIAEQGQSEPFELHEKYVEGGKLFIVSADACAILALLRDPDEASREATEEILQRLRRVVH